MTTESPTRLRVDAIDAKPIEIDWREAAGEYGEGFRYWEPFDYELGDDTFTLLAQGPSVAGVIIDGHVYDTWDDLESDHDGNPPMDESTFDALMGVEPYSWGSEGPMMNYYYPLDIDESAAEYTAAKLNNVPLCVVEVNGSMGLALTGGGMDLSWDICRAYILAGYLPPTHFADLPRYAGETPDREIIAAMRRALTIQKGWIESALSRLDSLESD